MLKSINKIGRNSNLCFLKSMYSGEPYTSKGLLPPVISDSENAKILNKTRVEMLTKINNEEVLEIPCTNDTDEVGKKFSDAVDKAYSKALPGDYGHS